MIVLHWTFLLLQAPASDTPTTGTAVEDDCCYCCTISDRAGGSAAVRGAASGQPLFPRSSYVALNWRNATE